jgi:hypothetical protein
VRWVSTSPAAKPRRITNSGVIGNSPTLPRTPSVPKYFLPMLIPQTLIAQDFINAMPLPAA